MQESSFNPQLKHVTLEVNKVTFQHKAYILLAIPMKGKSPLISILLVASDDDDQKYLMSSLRNLLEMNKTMITLERTLGEVLERMHNAVTSKVT